MRDGIDSGVVEVQKKGNEYIPYEDFTKILMMSQVNCIQHGLMISTIRQEQN